MNKIFYNDLNLFIDKNIYVFLHCLLKDIFLVKAWNNSKNIDRTLTNLINKINNKIVQKKVYFINREYTINNLNNIINLVKNQNEKFAGDILEGILIQIISLAFKTDKDNTFEKYIYNNLSRIRNKKFIDLEKWIQIEKFKPQELKNIIKLLNEEASEDNTLDYLLQESPFFNFIFNIFKLKYISIINLKNKDKINKYINKGEFISQEILNKIYDSIKYNLNTVIDKDFSFNSISSIISFILEKKQRIYPIFIVQCFFISVFIYCQNENSISMSFNNKEQKNINKDLIDIPYTYNLFDAMIEGRFAVTVLSPTKLSNIANIDLNMNNFREVGQFEISKIILFNKNIKNINLSSNLIRIYCIDFFNFGLGIYDNYSLEQLNLSHNYLKDNFEKYLSRLISHLKGLKTLILSSNNLKGCLSSFFIILKKLYRKNKIKLENLILNNCLLDDKSFYELGELLKCKYCKLKKLYLTNNSIPPNINLLKKLKFNKSLEIIHVGRSNINDNNTNDINVIISNTNIKCLYLFRNKLINFNQILRILYRTKLIKNNREENNSYDINNKSFLINLDLSNNDIYNKNTRQIKLLIYIIKKTTLYCLDISHILYGPCPKYYLKNTNYKSENYRRHIEMLKTMLEQDKKKHLQIIKDINSYKIDIKRFKYSEDDTLFNIIDKKVINSIIQDKNAKFPIFLKKKAKEIILKIIEDKENNKDIIDKIYINNKQNEEKIVNYMVFKKAKYNLTQLYKKNQEKQLIII